MSATNSIQLGTPTWAPLYRLLSDERLARRSAMGDGAAFALLFERHHQAVYRYCRSILRDAEDAADALQSTMEKAFAGVGRRDPAAPLRAWLFRIAHNESISLMRRRPSPSVPLEPDSALAPDVHATVEQRERLTQLGRDLGTLAPRQRGVLLMREVAGLSHQEIAAAFAISAGAVKQSIYEARSALHDEVRGRDTSCDAIRRTLSEGDGRTMRQRRVRGHLRSCQACRHFHAALRARGCDLAILAPVLPGPAAAAALAAITGSGGGSGGLLASLLGGSGASTALAKSAAVGAITVTAGAGAVGLTVGTSGHDPSGAGRAQAGTRGPSAGGPDRGTTTAPGSGPALASTAPARLSAGDGREEPDPPAGGRDRRGQRGDDRRDPAGDGGSDGPRPVPPGGEDRLEPRHDDDADEHDVDDDELDMDEDDDDVEEDEDRSGSSRESGESDSDASRPGSGSSGGESDDEESRTTLQVTPEQEAPEQGPEKVRPEDEDPALEDAYDADRSGSDLESD